VLKNNEKNLQKVEKIVLFFWHTFPWQQTKIITARIGIKGKYKL
jgi:hypothetical protein